MLDFGNFIDQESEDNPEANLSSELSLAGLPREVVGKIFTELYNLLTRESRTPLTMARELSKVSSVSKETFYLITELCINNINLTKIAFHNVFSINFDDKSNQINVTDKLLDVVKDGRFNHIVALPYNKLREDINRLNTNITNQKHVRFRLFVLAFLLAAGAVASAVEMFDPKINNNQNGNYIFVLLLVMVVLILGSAASCFFGVRTSNKDSYLSANVNKIKTEADELFSGFFKDFNDIESLKENIDGVKKYYGRFFSPAKIPTTKELQDVITDGNENERRPLVPKKR